MTFTDISLSNYDPTCHAGVTYEEGMKVMHVIKGGRVYSGVESFQVMYDAVGLGFIVKVLESPRVKRMADRVYDVWARLRLPMSGRPSLEVLLSRRSAEVCVCARVHVCVCVQCVCWRGHMPVLCFKIKRTGICESCILTSFPAPPLPLSLFATRSVAL